MKKLVLFASALLVSSVIMVSCSKENVVEEEMKSPVSVVEGRLVFESEATFSSTVKELFNQQDNLEEWKSQYDYTSLAEAYEAITDEEKDRIGTTMSLEGYEDIVKFVEDGRGEIEAIQTVGNNIYEVLYNHQGILQIGQKIYKEDYDYIKVIEDGDMSKLAMLKGITETNEALGITVYPISRVDKGTYQFDRECEKTWSTKRKMKGNLTYVNNGLKTSLESCTRNYRKRVGIWWLSKAVSLELDVNYDYTFKERSGPLHTWSSDDKQGNKNLTASNKSKLSHTFEHCTFYGNDECSVDTHSMDGTHKAKAKSSGTGSTVKTCTTTY